MVDCGQLMDCGGTRVSEYLDDGFKRKECMKALFQYFHHHLYLSLLLLLLSRFSRVRLYATPQTAVYQAPPSLVFSRQEHWSGLPFPSPMRESEVTQSCPTLSDPMDCSPPGSSVHGIFQARVLEWGAIAFSTQICSSVLLTMDTMLYITSPLLILFLIGG